MSVILLLAWGPGRAADTLDQVLVRSLAQPRFEHAAWGCVAAWLDSGEVFYQTNSRLLLKPASNAKLFTGALVLNRFGPSFRIPTSILAGSPPDENGRLEGDLLVLGRGDPSFSARFHQGDTDQSLEPLVRAVWNTGVRHIAGGLVGDETFFVGPPFGQSWTWADLGYDYGAEVSALSCDDNVIELVFNPGLEVGAPCSLRARPPPLGLEVINQIRTSPAGGKAEVEVIRLPGRHSVYLHGEIPQGHPAVEDAVSVPQPGLWFMRRLRTRLEEAGIQVDGDIRLHRWPEQQGGAWKDLRELARVESRPLSEIVKAMMKPSQNLYAHLLWLQAGARHLADKPPAQKLRTEQSGRRALVEFVQRIGIPRDEVELYEGSGLGRDALVTPHAVLLLLRHMRSHPHAASFVAALPVAGRDGTLRDRFVGGPAQDVVRARTGTLRHVLALSGYVEPPSGRAVVFSIMLNQYTGPTSEGREAIDEVVTALVRHAEAGKAVVEESPARPTTRVP